MGQSIMPASMQYHRSRLRPLDWSTTTPVTSLKTKRTKASIRMYTHLSLKDRGTPLPGGTSSRVIQLSRYVTVASTGALTKLAMVGLVSLSLALSRTVVFHPLPVEEKEATTRTRTRTTMRTRTRTSIRTRARTMTRIKFRKTPPMQSTPLMTTRKMREMASHN